MITGKTATSVHSPAQENEARWTAKAKEQSALNALGVFTQVFIGMPLYLYANVGTPGYLCILLTAPYAALLLIAANHLAKRGIPHTVLYGKRKNAARVFFFVFAFLHWADALLILLSLCAILREIMPKENPAWMALASALLCALGLRNGGKSGLFHLARFLLWVIFALLAFCVASAYPYGRMDHLFPLLGYGPTPILRGALWMCGCVSGCVWPLLMEEDEQTLARLTGRRSPLHRPLWAALLFSVVWMLCADWLMPIYTMRRAETLGWRVLLLTNMTPSIPAWSMLIAGITLLFLLALHDRALRASLAVGSFLNTKKGCFAITLALLLLLIPFAVRFDEAWLALVASLSAYRAAVMPVLLLAFFLFAPRKKEAAP